MSVFMIIATQPKCKNLLTAIYSGPMLEHHVLNKVQRITKRNSGTKVSNITVVRFVLVGNIKMR